MSREKRVLSSSWRFQPDPEDSGEGYGYSQADYDASRWREVSVPCSLEAGHPDLEWYAGVGWYRRAFHVPEAWRGQRVVLRFEGVNYHAAVWVNGQLVGRNEDGFLPFEMPIRDVVRYGHENVLAVKADNIERPGEVPGANVGWRPYGGILREVILQATPLCHVGEVRIVAEPQPGNEGTFSMEAQVVNEGEAGVKALFTVTVVDHEGRIAAQLSSQQISVPAAGQAHLKIEGTIRGIAAWSPNTPVLYIARSTLQSGGTELDQLDMRFGFRRIETDGASLLLNGEPIVLLGFNRHEDSPNTGMCTDLEMVRRDLLNMKEIGCNFVRLCHYPHHPGELDLCDELGILAMDEIPVYGSTGMDENEEQWQHKIEIARRQLAALVRRDWNHPSLIFWSVSNETHEEHPTVVQGNDELIRFVRELDPNRLAVHVSFRWDSRWDCAGHFDYDDVICVNGYPWMRDWRLTKEKHLAEMTHYWVENLERLHEAYPSKPILIAEFGYRSLEGLCDNLAAADVHARVLESQFAGMVAPYVCGATIWCYADHAWPMMRRGSARATTIAPYGVLTRSRRPKTAAYGAVRRMFRNKGT